MKSIPILLWKLTKKNIGSLSILTLQTVITILLLIGLIGKLQMISAAKNVTDAFQNQNAIYFTEYACYRENLPDLTQLFAKKADTASAKIGEITDLLLKTEKGETIVAYGYNDVMINEASVPLKEGIWFDQAHTSGLIPVIAVGRQYPVGLELSFLHPIRHTTVKAVVIGIIDEDTYLPTFNRSGTSDIATLSFFVSTPQFPLIVPYQCANIPSFQKEITADTSAERGRIIITGGQPALDAAQSLLKPYGSTVGIDQMALQYHQEIRDHMTTNGIVLLIFSILSIAGIGGVNGMQYLLNERRFVIYYMLGFTQKKCVLTEALRSFILILSSFLITVFLYWCTPVRSLYDSDGFYINAVTFLLIFLFLMILYACSSVAFCLKLGRTDLIQNYQKSTSN